MNPLSLNNSAKSPALCCAAEILDRGKLSKSHLYKLLSKGHFPKPIFRYGTKFTRWSCPEVDAWFADPQGWISQKEAEAGAQS